MESNRLDPKEALKNKAFAKTKPNSEHFENFKVNLSKLIDQINESESEEFHKNLVSDFLKNTYYGQRHFINTKGRYDLVIHNEMDAKSSVRVILETKKPSGNSAEMPRMNDLNKKAVQQLLLYFLQERFNHRNLDIKYLIVTNIYEWFIFDAKIFEKLFAEDRELVRKFTDFEKGQLSGDKTVFFHKEIAKPAIASVIDQIKFTHFDLRDYQSQELGKELKPIVSVSKPLIIDRDKEQKLIDLYKLFSPDYLLKLPFANDSNSLNKPFYNELLYIIGLTETKEGGKKLIGRPKEGDRYRGSLIENAIHQLDSLAKVSQLRKPEEFGENDPEKLFNVALRLAITWINRVLFLKLLEAQLIKYHRGNQAFSFLNLTKVKDYHDLNSLFFDVLAREQDKREAKVGAIFSNVPYLNSSLFEPTNIEQQTIVISNLRNEGLPIFGATVLADGQGKRRSGELNALEYLFEFLKAYNFSSDGSEDDQEDSEKLINAAVLGLIFEKINGYKDGSFYTPSFITMYMCRETIRRSLVQKFNEVKGWDCENLDQLYEKITDKKDANTIINSLKICDPAVGSGHFLVSALNEMIAIKSELKVLLDRSDKSLKDYRVEVRNDKLLVYDDEGKLFEYFPNNSERQRVQEALFHEKQTIIEGCLFGVDINPNSVIICRLRLWIELLKNAYYRPDGNLETLPNIDINIKEGNSLISRFGINKDLGLSLKSNKNKSNVTRYKESVKKYFNAKNKDDKKTAEKEIIDIKESFRSVLLGVNSPLIQKRNEIQLELNSKQLKILGTETNADKKAYEKRQKKLEKDLIKINVEIEEVNNEKFYRKNKAFEWQLEFPEVLSDDGDFLGFDVIIGNPPYIRQEEIKELKPSLQQNYQCYTGVADLFVYFYELSLNLLKAKGHLTYISSNKYFRANYGEKLRQLLADSTTIYNLIDFGDYPVFEEAIAYPSIITLSKDKSENNQVQALSWDETKKQDVAQFATVLEQDGLVIFQENFKADGWRLESSQVLDLLTKLRNNGTLLEEYINAKLYTGIKTGLNEVFVISQETKDQLIAEHPSSAEIIKPFLCGRDVKRWCLEFANQYFIKIESSENKKHPWSEQQEKDAEKIFAKTYPAVYRYFSSFRASLINRCDQGRFFWELRSCVYWQEFEQPKIIYPDIAQKAEFSYDLDNLYLGNTLYLLPTKELWVLGILNSQLVFWFYNQISPQIRGGFLRFIAQYVSQIPIPSASKPEKQKIEILVQKCLNAKKSDPKADTIALEKEIDQLIYQLYGLTEEEIKIVEGGK